MLIKVDISLYWKKVIPEKRGKRTVSRPDKTSPVSESLLFILMFLVSLIFNESGRYSLKREFILLLALCK